MNSFSLPNRIYTRKQELYERLLSQADSLFSIGWLRKILSDPTQLHDDDEKLFAKNLFCHYPVIVSQMKKQYEKSLQPSDFYRNKDKDREKLIWDFATSKFGETWEDVNANDDSWRAFVPQVILHDDYYKEVTVAFFHVFCEICVITDILNDHTEEHGIEIDKVALEAYWIEQREKDKVDLSVKTAIMEYVKRLLPLVKEEYKRSYELLWQKILELKEVKLLVYNKGKQQDTTFNRNLVAQIIHQLGSRIYTDAKPVNMVEYLEPGKGRDHSVRQKLGELPEKVVAKTIEEVIKGYI